MPYPSKNSPARSTALLLVLGSLACVQPGVSVSTQPLSAPTGDAFYVPPSPLPSQTPGTPIWARRAVFSTDDLLHSVDDSVDSWQLLYVSSSATLAPTAVSATLLVPRVAAVSGGPRALVGYAPGATGMGDACAPSHQLTDGTFVEDGIVKDALDQGWAVMVADYPGLGTPGDHTYLVNTTLAYSLLDGLRAAFALPEIGLSRELPVGLWGYSEGGSAAIDAAELADGYAPELEIVAAAGGGVSADAAKNAQALEGQLAFVPSVLIAIGYDAAYPELHLDRFLNARGQREFAEVRQQCIIPAMLQFAFGHMRDYTTSSPYDDPGYRLRLEQNRLGLRAPSVPLYLYHAENDEAIPLALAHGLRDAYCARGVSVTFRELAGADHLGGQSDGYTAALQWLAERFARVPAQSNCLPR